MSCLIRITFVNAPIKSNGVKRNLANITETEKSEVRAVIRFLLAKGNPKAEIHKELAPFIIRME